MTARVIVNRLWHYHFGRGLVGTPSDFGKQGEKPTHPELLDWLAAELMNPRVLSSEFRVQSGRPLTPNSELRTQNWSLKHIHRLIMTSETYKQSAAFNPVAAKVDPLNKLFWRFRRQRLE